MEKRNKEQERIRKKRNRKESAGIDSDEGKRGTRIRGMAGLLDMEIRRKQS